MGNQLKFIYLCLQVVVVCSDTRTTRTMAVVAVMQVVEQMSSIRVGVSNRVVQ